MNTVGGMMKPRIVNLQQHNVAGTAALFMVPDYMVDAYVNGVMDGVRTGPILGTDNSPERAINILENLGFIRCDIFDTCVGTDRVEEEDTCEGCGAPAEPPHTCPYSSDVDGDNESLCNCCTSCQNGCAQEI